MPAKKSRPRGRPALKPDEKKSSNLTFRARAELRERLAEAAQASGRSISEEIEWRLGQSFFVREATLIAAQTAVRETLAWVDQQREKEEAERNRLRPFSDLFKSPEEKQLGNRAEPNRSGDGQAQIEVAQL
jgi:hypothetical protein